MPGVCTRYVRAARLSFCVKTLTTFKITPFSAGEYHQGESLREPSQHQRMNQGSAQSCWLRLQGGPLFLLGAGVTGKNWLYSLRRARWGVPRRMASPARYTKVRDRRRRSSLAVSAPCPAHPTHVFYQCHSRAGLLEKLSRDCGGYFRHLATKIARSVVRTHPISSTNGENSHHSGADALKWASEQHPNGNHHCADHPGER